MSTSGTTDPSENTPPPGITITVYGHPAPQGSKRHVGKGIMVESSKHVAPWREDVRAAALLALNTLNRPAPLDGPLYARMVFTVARPASAPKARRWPDRMPDLSKLVRSTEDALTSAGVWADDARVVRIDTAKVYPGSGPDALDRPGARIVVRPATEADR